MLFIQNMVLVKYFSVSAKKIGGIDVQCYDIKFEKDKAIGLLPINKQSHLKTIVYNKSS